MGIYVGNKRYALFVGNTRRKVAEKEFPYDAEIKYLQSTGDAHIDTGITPTLSYSVEIEFSYVSLNKTVDASGNLFGCINGWGKNTFVTVLDFRTWKIWNCWGNKTSDITDRTFIEGLVGSWHTLVYKDYKTTIDGVQKGNAASSPTGAPVGSVYLFCAKNYASGNLYGVGTTKQIRSFKMYDASSNLVMDLIPVRKGTTGYMYDKVSGQLFDNSGTGDFVLGPDKVLPYDAEVEYLRGTGTQYIDSGIECTGDLSVKCKFRVSTNENSALAGGIYSGSTYFRHHLTPFNYNQNFYWLQYSTNTYSSIKNNYSTNTWYEIEIDATNGTYKINNSGGRFTPVSASLTTNAGYGIFARLSGNMNAQLRGGNNDFAMLKLLKDGVLLRDYIPVRVGTTGYLYDKVSRQLFGNAGTGDFILGPDKT